MPSEEERCLVDVFCSVAEAQSAKVGFDAGIGQSGGGREVVVGSGVESGYGRPIVGGQFLHLFLGEGLAKVSVESNRIEASLERQEKREAGEEK